MFPNEGLYREAYELSGLEAIKLIRRLDTEDRLGPEDVVSLIDEVRYNLAIYRKDIPENFGELPISWFEKNGLKEYLRCMKAVIDMYKK